jgi:plasmid stabilization system protein ParE
MSLPLILTQEAEEDIAEAKAWYNRQRQGLGDEFVLCVEEALERISRLPKAAAVVFQDLRRLVVRRFPYGVFFRVEEDYIAVLAVYHSRRDPRGWQARAN